MAVPGEAGGDCRRCGETTVMVGTGHAVVGAWCEACDLVSLLAYHDADVGEHMAEPWTPDDETTPEDRRPDR